MSARKLLLLVVFLLVKRTISQDIRAVDISIVNGTQFHCATTTCLPFSKNVVSDIFNCRINCLAVFQCQAARFNQVTLECALFGVLYGFNGTMVSDINSITMIVSTGMRTPPESESNWVVNGDGETGPCNTMNNVLHPTDWNYSGTVTQVTYNNSVANQKTTDPGPSNRGRCHFYGQTSAVTTMWQVIDMTTAITPAQLDNQTMAFDLSAWIGGYMDQDDNAQVSLTFVNQANQTVGNTTALGPVLAADRAGITSLLYRKATGQVPVGARSFKVSVTMTRVNGTTNDGDVDNIVLRLY
ncbi:unnamed protein product [Adineta ricciae]|uniref:Uncharacterized protein n=1 Tax=Adineta ricciae TaxID=249248 RepID=A0A814TE96_ADIRI|nr:unnamed protein product [Adineta ricciae]CAF1567976.1 unnamed protein product [Adineta ricciae]